MRSILLITALICCFGSLSLKAVQFNLGGDNIREVVVPAAVFGDYIPYYLGEVVQDENGNMVLNGVIFSGDNRELNAAVYSLEGEPEADYFANRLGDLISVLQGEAELENYSEDEKAGIRAVANHIGVELN